MEISEEKRQLLKHIIHWYKYEQAQKPYLTLGGYAGTGKTTLLALLRRVLLQAPKFRVAFAAYTGKATRVLKNYLDTAQVLQPQDSVSTIHALIYSPIENDQQQIIAWKRKEEIKADLIVIDEASMIDEKIWDDLLSYGRPILAVGDHGQLPPINGNFHLMEEPDLRLETIFRQAAENPIIQLSIMARETGIIPVGNYGKGVRKLSKFEPDSQEIVSDYLQTFNPDTLLLCGYNNSRIRLNQQMRQMLGFESAFPQAGDRVICLRNNQRKGIYNGMLGTLERIATKTADFYEVKISLDDDSTHDYEGVIVKDQFGAKEGLNFTQQRKLTLQADLFDFAYALTVHKAQGSQAQRVILFEERFKQMDDAAWRRWLYTAVTRAQEELIIIGE